MFEIEAHYHDRKIYLSDGREYPLGEILLRYFSANIKNLEDIYDVCKRAKSQLNISSEYQPYVIGERAQKVEDAYERIFDIAKKLPPYDKQHFRRGVLQNLFAYYDDLFVNYYRGQKNNEDDDNYYFIDRSEGLDDGYISENLNELKQLPDYHLDDEKALNNSEKKQYAIEFIAHIRRIADEFETFVADLLRVKKVFMPFADELCDHNNYPSTEKVIEVFQKFNATHNLSNSYLNLESSGSMCMGHTVIETKKGPILCETYRFTSLGAFLYFELFKCIEEKYMPVKCRNCGRWFIMKHTTFSHYCKRLISSNPPKSCRDISMRHTFKDKLKNDPVWEIYNRAYKQHYARFMKNKMSKSEFAEWGEYAIELRTKAAAGELEMEEYQKLIRI